MLLIFSTASGYFLSFLRLMVNLFWRFTANGYLTPLRPCFLPHLVWKALRTNFMTKNLLTFCCHSLLIRPTLQAVSPKNEE